LGKYVMVVDDDEHIRDALSSILEDEGYSTILADNGKSALEQLRASSVRPCLIFLDLMMPEMDGWEFRQQQKAIPMHADIPVVVITAAGVDRSATIDAAAVLHKPVSADTIMRAVDQFC
jgi:CheY-like chemotaxis protein